MQISEAYKRITDPNSFKDDEDDMMSDFPVHEEELFDVFNMMMAEMFMDMDLFHSYHYSSYFEDGIDELDSEDERFWKRFQSKKTKKKTKKPSMEEDLKFEHERMQRQFDAFDVDKLMKALFEDDLRVPRRRKARTKIQVKKSKTRSSNSSTQQTSTPRPDVDDSDDWETESSDDELLESMKSLSTESTNAQKSFVAGAKASTGPEGCDASIGDRVVVRGQER